MIRLAITFLILALVAALLGFGNFAGDLAWIAKILILVFAVLAILSFVMGRRVVDSGI
jgi:uncharacterized membrane protein YtjA (UPF0391 family)